MWYHVPLVVVTIELYPMAKIEETPIRAGFGPRQRPGLGKVLTMDTRTERDAIGEYQVPADSYYGIDTARARATSR